MQALIGGSVDYASAAGSIIAAGVRGMPVRLVLIVNSKAAIRSRRCRLMIKSVPATQGESGRYLVARRRGRLLTQLILTQHGLTLEQRCRLSIVIGSARGTGDRPAEPGASPLACCRRRASLFSIAKDSAGSLTGRLSDQLSLRRCRRHGRKDQKQSRRSLRLRESQLKGCSTTRSIAPNRRTSSPSISASKTDLWRKRCTICN